MEMTKESLASLSVKELMDICRQNGLPCYHGKNRYKKDELVATIVEAKLAGENGQTTVPEVEPQVQSAGDTKTVGDNAENGAKEKKPCSKPASEPVIDMEKKMPYIRAATVGTLVAFRLENGKVKSAKIIKKSTKNERFMLETEYGAQFVVDYKDIIWVRTTKRWPLGVYKLLKGLGDDDGQAEVKQG